jgi:hypothetical protein
MDMGGHVDDEDKRGLGKTVLGWFIAQDGGKPEPAADTDALIAKYAGAADASAVPAVPAVQLSGPLPTVVNGKVDFLKVFEAAGIGADERGRVEKAQELLRSLPAETPQPTKKQIVEASLKAFGVATEKIIEAGVAEIGALEAFIQAGQADTQNVLGDGNKRLADLEKQMAEVRAAMQQAVADQEARVRSANEAKLAVQQVLEFFGKDAVAKVVQESPKLHQPTGA